VGSAIDAAVGYFIMASSVLAGAQALKASENTSIEKSTILRIFITAPNLVELN
jgi:hypothetical protein